MWRKLIPILFFVLSGTVFAIAVGVFLYSDQPTKPPAPVLTFTPETIHFGTVTQGTEHGKAVVTNVSTKPIVIKAVTKGCDCSEVVIERGKLKPNEQREIAFQWDTRGRRGENAISIGVIYTEADDQTERIAPLIIEADIIPDYDISPEKLEFVSTQQDTHQITITYKEGTFFCIRDVMIQHPAFSTIQSPDQQSVTITFDPEKWTDGTRRVQARVVTTSMNQPIFLLPINIRVSKRR